MKSQARGRVEEGDEGFGFRPVFVNVARGGWKP
jgi:hypothetical protein